MFSKIFPNLPSESFCYRHPLSKYVLLALLARLATRWCTWLVLVPCLAPTPPSHCTFSTSPPWCQSWKGSAWKSQTVPCHASEVIICSLQLVSLTNPQPSVLMLCQVFYLIISLPTNRCWMFPSYQILIATILCPGGRFFYLLFIGQHKIPVEGEDSMHRAG